MPSKMVTNRLRLARAVDAAVMPNLDIVNPALGTFFEPFLEEGETLPDLELLQKLLGRVLNTHHGTLIELDKINLDERNDDIEPRLTRDSATQELRRKMFALRDVIDQAYGPERSAMLLALEGQPISRTPDVLWRQARYTLERLENPDHELPEVVFFGNVLDRSRLAAELRPAVEALGEVLHTLAEERRKLDTTRGAKTKAIGRFDTLFTASTRILEGLYLIAEAPHLAERIRPTVIRRRRKAAEEQQAEPEKGPEVPPASPGSPSADGDTAALLPA